MTARLYSLHPLEGYRPLTFAGHRDAIVGAYISTNSKAVRHLQIQLIISQRKFVDLYY
jgi:hypothetical protein